MKKLMFTIVLFLLLTACGPEVVIEIDQEQTRIIHDESIEMISLYVRVENKGQLPANELYARFLVTDSFVQTALGDQQEITFTDSDNNPEQFQVSGNSSFFFSEVFSLQEEVTDEDLQNAITVEIFDGKGDVVASHTIEQVVHD
ncbi:hypothetical protein N0O92_21395 [Alkalihalobacillus sp. MEB130]|uniref:hypothetical protein n=1 Tax=Alkalihalobacillus sp. MEB130 TaxID=2976704 RepID=UPI0028E00B90|nr:hypothetical protein [Alkalihalobacillus sp. MEB130]MDT8862749.1 hypothetical protein [Alkalihalobacillus sp. MEB130]